MKNNQYNQGHKCIHPYTVLSNLVSCACKPDIKRTELQPCTYPLQRLVALRSQFLDAISVGFTCCLVKEK